MLRASDIQCGYSLSFELSCLIRDKLSPGKTDGQGNGQCGLSEKNTAPNPSSFILNAILFTFLHEPHDVRGVITKKAMFLQEKD